MKPIRQLFRQPIKTVIGVFLLTLATAALCVCVGQSRAAAQTRAAVGQGYTTVAVISDYYTYDRQGSVPLKGSLNQSPEAAAYLKTLRERLPDAVQGIAQNHLVSAYCPEMTPLCPDMVYLPDANMDGSARPASPYNQGFFEIELTEIGEPIKENWLMAICVRDTRNWENHTVIPLAGTVVRAFSLHPGYDDPAGKTARISLYVDSEEAFQAMGLETGKRYLLFTNNYSDEDWDMRKMVASRFTAQGVLPENIDWKQDLDVSRKNPYFDNIGLLSPKGVNGERVLGIYMTEEDMKSVNSAHFEVVTNPLSMMNRSASGAVQFSRWGETVEMDPEEWLDRYGLPTIQEITTTAEDILENDQLWKRAAEELEIDNHAFPVLGVDNVEAMAPFASEKTFVTEGRTFTEAEYRSGSPVCLISETLAQENNVSIGDLITLNFYEQDDAPFRQSLIWSVSNPGADYYHSQNGFAQVGQFEIVGLYRQTQEWSRNLGDFNPITILVPSASIKCRTYTDLCGVFSTVLLKNGTGDALLTDAEAAGFPELFVIQDQGYSEIAGALDGYAKAAGSVLWIGIAIFLAVVTLYLILYPLAMGKQAKQMWTLGTPRGEIFKNLLLSGGFPAIIGGILAIPLAVLGNRWLQARLAESTESASITVSVTAFQLTFLCLLSAAAILLLTALCSWLLTRRSEN